MLSHEHKQDVPREAAGDHSISSCCCCSHINSHNQVCGHRTGSSHSGAEEYPRWYTHISQLTQLMPPQETYITEIGSQSTMCQIHTGAYVSLLAPGETDYYTACHLRKTTTYILHVVSITTDTHDRRKSTGGKKRRKEKKMKEKEEKRRKRDKKIKRKMERRETTKTRKAREDKTRRGSKERRKEVRPSGTYDVRVRQRRANPSGLC